MAIPIPVLTSLISSLGSLFGVGASSLFAKKQNAHLTGREQEANAFTAEQAQINRDFSEDMSNTAYQRAVVDMQSAGLNPALMYGNGSAASTPTGSNASSVGAGYESMSNMVQAVVNASKAPAEIALMKSEEKKNDSDRDVNEQKKVEIQNNAKLLKAKFEEQEVVNQYVDAREKASLAAIEQTVKESQKRIDDMDSQIKKRDQETQNLVEQLRKLKAETDIALVQLEVEQDTKEDRKREVAERVKQIIAGTSNLVKQGKLTQLEVDNWFFNNAQRVTCDKSFNLWVVGAKVGEELLVFPDGRVYSPAQNKYLERRWNDESKPEPEKDWNNIKKEYPE